MNKLQIMSDVDTVDHITVLPRWNKPFDRDKAVKTIKHCKTFYGDIFTYTVEDAARLAAATDQQLLDELVAIREELLRRVF